MNNEFLKARSTRYAAYATVYTAIIIAALVLVNWLANRYNKSFDSTSNKRFSLSDQTNKVVKGLKQPVALTYYDKSESFSRAKDLLDRYGNLSTRLTVNYVDPDKKPTVARAAGIRELGQIVIEGNNKREEAKSLTEEEVTSALVRLVKGGQRSACAVTGSGEHGFQDTGRAGYSFLKEQMERNNYKTRSVSLLDKPEVPKDCTILIVGGPRFDYVQPVVDAIRTYVEGGGHALIALGPPLQFGKEDIAENAALVSMLQGWGATLNKDLLYDESPVGQLLGLSAVVPLAVSFESHPIVRDFKEAAVAMPLTRSIDIKTGGKATVEKLFSTSNSAKATTNLASAEIDPAKGKPGPYVMGAAGTIGSGAAAGRFVVTGSADWLDNNILSARAVANRDLALNVMNWLSSDEDLISIRPKEPENRPLTMSQQQMRTVFFASVVMFPLLAVLAGISQWWKRR